jgi:MFS transporter, DHA1 family, multidrug resistance protein
MGIVLPQAVAGALSPFPHIAGVASALLGFLQMGVASLAGLAVGQLYNGSSRPMATVIALMGCACFAIYRLMIRRRLVAEFRASPRS